MLRKSPERRPSSSTPDWSRRPASSSSLASWGRGKTAAMVWGFRPVAKEVRSPTPGLGRGHDQRLRGQPFLLVYAEGYGDELRVLTTKAGRSRADAQEAVLSWMDSYPLVETSSDVWRGAMDLCVAHHVQLGCPGAECRCCRWSAEGCIRATPVILSSQGT